jgi:hypothetical protein
MPKRPLTTRQRAIAAGYRSGLEERNADRLKEKGVPFQYEEKLIRYIRPARNAKYTPDFILENGIIVETKGRFVTDDRQKMILIKDQHPDLDIRFVFSNPNTRISKKSKTTYAMWCDKQGFLYAKGDIPDAWLNETPNPVALDAIEKAGIAP